MALSLHVTKKLQAFKSAGRCARLTTDPMVFHSYTAKAKVYSGKRDEEDGLHIPDTSKRRCAKGSHDVNSAKYDSRHYLKFYSLHKRSTSHRQNKVYGVPKLESLSSSATLSMRLHRCETYNILERICHKSHASGCISTERKIFKQIIGDNFCNSLAFFVAVCCLQN